MEALVNTLKALVDGRPSEKWVQAHGRIDSERRAIEEYLSHGDRPAVYGFDTMLGQLDSVIVDGNSEQILLDAHLMGRLEPKDATAFNAISAVKLQQMSLGGTGVHPETYAALLESFQTGNVELMGAWRDSYSSGDVVPAAWWVKNLIDLNVIGTLNQGDVISLINGNFVSTAAGIDVFLELESYVALFLAVSSSFMDEFPGQGQGLDEKSLLVRAMWRDSSPQNDSATRGSATGKFIRPSIQRPISTRDGRLYLDVAVNSMRNLANCLNKRLSTRSSNPQFRVDSEGVRSLSQSSFLGFELTFALTNALQTISLLMGGMQRFTQQCSELLQSKSRYPEQKLIQPPKISRAMVESARHSYGALPINFTGSESGGVEDVWDLSLITTIQLSAMIAEAKSQVVILDELNGGRAHASAQHVQEVSAALRSAIMGQPL